MQSLEHAPSAPGPSSAPEVQPFHPCGASLFSPPGYTHPGNSSPLEILPEADKTDSSLELLSSTGRDFLPCESLHRLGPLYLLPSQAQIQLSSPECLGLKFPMEYTQTYLVVISFLQLFIYFYEYGCLTCVCLCLACPGSRSLADMPVRSYRAPWAATWLLGLRPGSVRAAISPDSLGDILDPNYNK